MRDDLETTERSESEPVETRAPSPPAAPPAAANQPRSLRRDVTDTLRTAGPVVLTQLGMMTMGLVDTLMVGRMGAVPLAAVALGDAFFFTVVILFAGGLTALDPIVAQAFGAGKRERCGEELWNGIWLAILAAIPITALFVSPEFLLRAAGQEADVAASAAAYLQAKAISVAPFMLWFALRSFLNGIGDVRPVMLITFAANLVNVFANWVLIYGNLGAPALGVAGAGWATSISRYSMLVALGLWIARPRYRAYGVGPRRPDLAGMRAVVRLGGPIGLQIGLEVGVFSAVSIIMGWLGAVALGAHQIAIKLASFTFMVPLGMSVAASVRVGQAIGRGDLDAAARAGRIALGLGASFMAFCGVAFALAPAFLARLFTPDAAVIAAAVVLLRIAAAFQVFDGIQTVATGCLRGAGDTRTPLLANLLAHWGLGLPLGWALAIRFGFGAPGLWYGLTASLVAVAVVLLWRFESGRWRARAKLL